MNTDLQDALPLPLPRELKLRRLPDGGAIGRYRRIDLASVFQPVIATDTPFPAAHETFIRTHGNGALDLSPWNLFALVADDAELVALDRLCRTVHALNFRAAALPGALFLNVHGRLLAAVSDDHGRAFRRVVDALCLEAARVILETPEAANQDRLLLALVLANYRRNGFRVAANVASLEDLETLVRAVRPDFVKLDARRLHGPADIRRALAVARKNGIRPVFTHVETGELHGRLSAHSDIWLQGWAIGRPAAMPPATVRAYAPSRDGLLAATA